LVTTRKINQINILLIDDEPDFLDLSKIYLTKIGQGILRIDATSDPREVLEKFLETEMYDVIICDYEMPYTSGLELLAEIRKQLGEIPFIIFTGRGREEVAIQALNLGANFYIRKGLDMESQFKELFHKIEILHRHEQTKKDLAESEAKFRSLFEQTPIAQAERDYSEVFTYLNYLRVSGIIDLKTHFETHKEEVIKCVKMIKLKNVNQAALELFGVKTKKEFEQFIPLHFMDQDRARQAFIHQLLQFSKGIIEQSIGVPLKRADGKEIYVNIIHVIAEEFREDLSRIWAKYIDITDLKQKEKKLHKQIDALH
jgi:PAS domain S-box-containing protein